MDNIKDTGQEDQESYDTMDEMDSDDLNLTGSQISNVDAVRLLIEKKIIKVIYDITIWQ